MDINTTVTDAQPIQVTIDDSKPINIVITDEVPLDIVVTDAQPINVNIIDAIPIDIQLGDIVEVNYISGTNDKNYSVPFAPTDNLLVNHNLNKYPAVDIMNSAGDEVVGSINYLSLNSLLVSFSAPFGGRVTCN